jgi:HEAT repeat protein
MPVASFIRKWRWCNMSKPFDCTLVDVHLEGKSVEELLYLVGDVDHGCKQKAMDTVLSMGLRANYETLEKALRNDDDADLRNSAMEVLVRFGKQAVPKLLMLLRDENEEVRNFSAVMLGDIASREAVGPLIEALRDSDANVSHAAAEALGKIGDRSALLPLLELCSGNFWLQYPAVVAMGEMRDNRAVPRLLQLLDDEMLKEPVIEALGKIGDPRALYYLAEILCSPDAQLAAQAARAIVAIQNALAGDLP